ncbi:hypothetical protein GOBAR_DD21135 [Gossypium barbadense]|nr:hypothetical protein GOBAR_DD21135 [Gossypium barbadense]
MIDIDGSARKLHSLYSGPSKHSFAYVKWLKEDDRFLDILVQTSPAFNEHAFPKLKLRYKPHLYNMHAVDMFHKGFNKLRKMKLGGNNRMKGTRFKAKNTLTLCLQHEQAVMGKQEALVTKGGPKGKRVDGIYLSIGRERK